MSEMNVPLPLLASLLFTMIGPIALLPLFATTTAAASPELRSRIAGLAALFALGTLGIAVFVGAGVMQSAGTSRTALIIAAGIILTLTALRNIFGAAPQAKAQEGEPTSGLALMPMAIPGIVTPMGVAIVILFASYFPDIADRLAILGVIAAIMVANYFAMRISHWFMRVIGAAPLLILGAIFGVLQAAMGIEMIMSGLKMSGFVLTR
jgi:multiple antibiotic resistance protein